VKKMDEMDRNIRLRSEEYGFKFILLALSIWTLYECYLTFSVGQKFNIVPSWILIGAVLTQGFSEIIMKRKMILGDEEYKEPNKILWSIILSIAIAAIVVSMGFYILHNNLA